MHVYANNSDLVCRPLAREEIYNAHVKIAVVLNAMAILWSEAHCLEETTERKGRLRAATEIAM